MLFRKFANLATLFNADKKKSRRCHNNSNTKNLTQFRELQNSRFFKKLHTKNKTVLISNLDFFFQKCSLKFTYQATP